MHNITRQRLNQSAALHPETRSALARWYKLVKSGTFQSFVELRVVFPSTDQVGKLTVFNLGGNKARIIVAIHDNRQKMYVRAILSHPEYDEGKWRE